MKFSSRLKLKSQMILVIGLMALLQTGFIGIFAIHYLQQSLDEQIGQRALYVANTIASIPEVVQAIEEKNTAFLQPLSLKLAKNIDARFVVIGDREGIRLAHPNIKKIGFSMQDDEGDDNAQALVLGNGYISTALGSLGWSMRGKAPVRAIDGTHEKIVGIVSVGYQIDKVAEIINHHRFTLIVVIFTSFLLSVFIAVWVANHFKKAIFGLEPQQIAHLFDEQKAILESVREGIIAINNTGKVTTVNKAAIETLDLPKGITLTDCHISDILDDTSMVDVLETGQPQFDQEVWHNNQNIIANRLPLKQGHNITGVVSSFRRKDELDMISKKLSHIQQYADSLRSQAHEYSNKLHTIAGLIQIGASHEAMELIGQESQGHQELIQLLIKAVPDPVIAGCLLGKYNRAKELGLQLMIDEESHMAELPDHIPREHLVSIIGNLIDNALEATLSHKGLGGEIHLSMTDLGNDLIFECEDQGIGIAKGLEQKIFDKGVTSKNKDGHGIGLYLVKKLLIGLHGTITVANQEEGGRFTVYIPKYRN